jgi:long-chain acyl-CoA synthetase
VSEFSVPPVVTVGDAANLTDPVWDNAEKFPNGVQFLRRNPGGNRSSGDAAGDTSGGWTDVTSRQFRDEVIAVARGLIAAGVQPGMRVGLMSQTRYEWTVIDYAILAIGAVTVPIYETSSKEQLAWILSDSGATACAVETDDHSAMLAGVRDRVPSLQRVWQIDAGDIDELATAGASVDPAEVETRRRAIKGADIATVIYTSGTTGRPKGCILTHRNIYSDVANAIPVWSDVFNERASTLLFLPLAHAFARLIQIGAVQARTKMAHSAEMEHLTNELQQFRPTFVLAVPRVFEKIYNGAARKAQTERKGRIFARADRIAVAYSQALDSSSGPGLRLRLERLVFDRLVYRKLRAALGGRCRHAISGGAPLNPQLGHFFRGIGVTILEGYGLTETSPAAAANLPDHMRIGTVGRPLPGVAIRTADDGEVLIKGDLVFQGYWNNPEATTEALTAEGWLRSGDLGELDDSGFLRITGRKKEIIVTAGGKHVVPAVLEDRVRAHPLVSQSLVVGDRQPFIAALVTIDEQAWPKWLSEHGRPTTTSVAEMRDDQSLRSEIQTAIDEANKAVSHPEAIKKFRILPRDFTEANGELTPTLKVKREAVQKTCAPEIAAIYSK